MNRIHLFYQHTSLFTHEHNTFHQMSITKWDPQNEKFIKPISKANDSANKKRFCIYMRVLKNSPHLVICLMRPCCGASEGDHRPMGADGDLSGWWTEKRAKKKTNRGQGAMGGLNSGKAFVHINHIWFGSIGHTNKKGELQKRLQGGKEPDSPMNNNCESRFPEKKNNYVKQGNHIWRMAKRTNLPRGGFSFCVDTLGRRHTGPAPNPIS